MKFFRIFRFELAYQARRVTTPLFFVILGAVAFLFIRGNFLEDALYDDFYVNSPYVIACVTVFGCMLWLLLAAALAGEVAARDSETGMHPLSYTAPVGKAAYLGGRFLAAFVLNAAIMLAVPIGIMLSVYLPGVAAGVIGPFRPEAYLAAYGCIALPNVFIGTATQFACAALSRRALAGYFGSMLLFATVYGGIFLVFYFGGSKELATLLDAFTQLTVFDLTERWSSIQKSSQPIPLQGPLLQSRLVWIAIASGALALTYVRFRFTHHTLRPPWRLLRKAPALRAPLPATTAIPEAPASAVSPAPASPPVFGLRTYLQQALAVALASFRAVAKGWAGLPPLALIAGLTVLIIPEHMHNMGTPLLPATGHILTFMTAPVTGLTTPWLIIPLLIILWAGEIVWRERKAGLGEITDAMPTPDLVPVLGKFIGLAFLIISWIVILTLAGILVQLRMGYYHFEPGLYLKILFGLQLPEYLLFGLLALAIQGLAPYRFMGHLTALLAYLFIIFAGYLGLQHHLLVYGSGPSWSYNDIRGFGASLAPWIWFRGYWAAWALLLAVVASLFWVRGMERGLRLRLRIARLRLNNPTRLAAAGALGHVLALGGFIFYNTNVLNEYAGDRDWLKLRAAYELRYGRFKHAAQPRIAATRLEIDLFPRQRQVNIRGSYRLLNGTGSAIDTIHVATIRTLRTGAISFDRPAALIISDDNHGHRSYALQRPLQPGDTLELRFEVRYRPRGFSNDGAESAIVANGSYFTNKGWLPAIGYQAEREILKPGERRAHGLPARPLIPTLADAAAAGDITGESDHGMHGAAQASFEAVMSTDADQVAIAPGALRRTWASGGRRYFHYGTEAPLGDYAFFSAVYSIHRERFQGIDIQLYHHPGHTANLKRMLRSVRASLDYYGRSFGPYPFGYIRLVENPVRKLGAHADATMIDYGHYFNLFNPGADPEGLDLPFAVIAHEVAHQWWGAQLPYAVAEGAGLLTESPAWYSAMGVVEETYGRAHLQRLLRFFRQPYPIPPIRQSAPLLRGRDPYAFYRKGPFALFGLSEYMGKDRVDTAYRRLIERHNAGTLPAATSLDLYRELEAVTPDTLRYLLHDLLAANTFWELKTAQATAKQTAAGEWLVSLQLHARKLTTDPAGKETLVPMDEWVPVGVFAPSGEGREFGKTLHLQKHRIRSGAQTITLTVPQKPADAGIDPFHLLIDTEPYDNVERVKIQP